MTKRRTPAAELAIAVLFAAAVGYGQRYFSSIAFNDAMNRHVMRLRALVEEMIVWSQPPVVVPREWVRDLYDETR